MKVNEREYFVVEVAGERADMDLMVLVPWRDKTTVQADDEDDARDQVQEIIDAAYPGEGEARIVSVRPHGQVVTGTADA